MAAMRAQDDWRDDAACRGEDTALFFPDSEAQGDAARAICTVCPVRRECLNWALATNQREGIWGGMNERERRRERRLRQAAARKARRAA